ncbi:MAG: ParA family protein [Clostridiales bacterium]|nr:ParA family protein [Clostridiales bacterium]
MRLNKKYYVLIGHFGSGKTELALALARHLNAGKQGGVVLVDLDIVNPYFRSSEHRDLLETEGIDVIMPSFAHTTVDVPALSADVNAVFESERYRHVVFDVGGDASGATALGRYHPQIQKVREQMRVLYVVNPCRPLSSDEEDICALLRHIEARARIKADILVNNANLQRQTTAWDLIDAQALLERVSKRISVPVGMMTGYGRLRGELPEDMQAIFFPIEPMMLPEWLEDDTV